MTMKRVALTFWLTGILFLVPFDALGQELGNKDVVASVEGQGISVEKFRRAYQAQREAYTRAYEGRLDEKTFKQLGIHLRVLQQLIDEEAGLIEAKRLGISASDEEVDKSIRSQPGLQEKGRFIGEQRLRELLRRSNPPTTPEEFREAMRRALILERLQTKIGGSVAAGTKNLNERRASLYEAHMKDVRAKMRIEINREAVERAMIPATPAESGSAPAPRRLGPGVPTPKKIVDVDPVYPPIALSARVAGLVFIEIIVGTDGSVTDPKVVRSIPLLDPAALEAVRQWKFEPTLVDGVPTPIIMTVMVSFTLK